MQRLVPIGVLAAPRALAVFVAAAVNRATGPGLLGVADGRGLALRVLPACLAMALAGAGVALALR